MCAVVLWMNLEMGKREIFQSVFKSKMGFYNKFLIKNQWAFFSDCILDCYDYSF